MVLGGGGQVKGCDVGEREKERKIEDEHEPKRGRGRRKIGEI